MSLADRLRAVVRPDGSADAGLYDNDRMGRLLAGDTQSVAEILGGEYREWQRHPYLVVERKYPPGHRHGRVALADCAPGHNGCWPALSILEPAFAQGRPVLFVDLETTGLAGGAGTYAFLVGCGWFEGATFRVRQFLLAGFGAERGLLEHVADTAAGAGAVATYNGNTFDLPLIETRFLLHRIATPFDGMPHLDMLHPARRLWRSKTTASVFPEDRQTTCRLAAMEEAVLGHNRVGDVPGFEIPSRYFQYVRSGNPRPLEAVLEHNRLDLLSLAMLTGRAAQLLERGAAGAASPREALGLGRLYQRGKMIAEARACFARAAGLDVADDLTVVPSTEDFITRAEALRAYAVVCRRDRRYQDAAEAWRRLVELPTCPPHFVHEAAEALAVHHEHRRRDFHLAREFALQALEFDTTIARRQAVQHRVARLDRKLACSEHRGGAGPQKDRRRHADPGLPAPNPGPLF